MAEPSASSSSADDAASSAATTAPAAATATPAGAGLSAESIVAAARARMAAGEAPGFDRLNIPFIIDKVDVTDPDLIRMITKHEDVDRLHGVPTKDKPL